MLQLEITPYQLDFKFQARTSRGEIKHRKVWFIKVTDRDGVNGVGEVAPIERLSPESPDEVEEELGKLAPKLKKAFLHREEEKALELASQLVSEKFPSIRFGLETALLELVNGGSRMFFGNTPDSIHIPINGLVWMGDKDFMQQQIREKLDQGFSCIKLKVGSLDFDVETELIRSVRKVSDDLVIRLDANGAFQTHEVLVKLKQWSKFNIHSIEQPILPKQWEAMEMVCLKSYIPIALDEELIGIDSEADRIHLIQELKPQYLVLKPSLLGGLQSIKNWIDLAEMHGMRWWLTSYLESNIGLNAIAQFAAKYPTDEYSGLGTGGLYHRNIESPMLIKKGYLKMNPNEGWGEIPIGSLVR